MPRNLEEVVVVDAVRTAYGRAGEKGIFWKTRAEDLVVPLLKAMMDRNPGVTPAMIEDNIWGVTNQVKEQGGTLGRLVTMLAGWGWRLMLMRMPQQQPQHMQMLSEFLELLGCSTNASCSAWARMDRASS